MDLRANAIITAVDRFSGPVQRMAGALNTFSGRAAVIANASQRVGTALGGMGLTGALGMGMLLQQAERFNKAVFGVGVASIGEAMDKLGNVDLARPLGDMRRIESASMDMSQRLRTSVTSVSEIHETLAKAGLEAERLGAAAEVTAILAKTDYETPANKMAEFMHVISILHKPQPGESFGDFMRRQADMLNIAASETRLSVGSLMEGLRQFQPLGARMGLNNEEMISMLMMQVRAGLNPIEGGTALKSSLTRAYKPTAAGMMSLNSVLGPMGKSLSDYTMATAQDPKRARSSLNYSLGYVKGKFGTEIERMLYDAHREGYTGSDGFIQSLTQKLAKEGGFNQLSDLQRIENQVRTAILSPGKEINVLQLWKDYVKGSDGDIGKFINYFEGRHIARLLPVLEGIVAENGDTESLFQQFMGKLTLARGQGLDAVETLWSKSSFGNMKAMAAAWERIIIRLANSPGIQGFVNGLERIAAAIEKADPLVIKIGAWAAIIGLLAGPTAMIVGGLASGLALIATGGAAAAFVLSGIGSAAMLLKDGFNPAVVTTFAAGIGVLALALGPVSATMVGLGATAALLMTRWEPVKAFFADTAANIKSVFQDLFNWLGSGLDRIMQTWRTIKAAGSALWDGRFSDAWNTLTKDAPAALDRARESNNDRMEPLARTGDDLMRSLTGGANRVEVQGQATIRVEPIRVEVIGPGRVLNPDQQPATQSVPLNTGRSMGDLGVP